MTSDEAVERVAKSVHEWHCPEEPWDKIEHWTGPKMQDYIDAAKAIIAALNREAGE